jgi:hypothetical protein
VELLTVDSLKIIGQERARDWDIDWDLLDTGEERALLKNRAMVYLPYHQNLYETTAKSLLESGEAESIESYNDLVEQVIDGFAYKDMWDRVLAVESVMALA